jgi:hypothetical protein
MICPRCAETIDSRKIVEHLKIVHPGTLISVQPIEGTDLVLLTVVIEHIIETDEDLLRRDP